MENKNTPPKKNQKPQKESVSGDKFKRISILTASIMIFFALGIDVSEVIVDWIPGFGQVISYILDVSAIFMFSVWFLILGVDLISPKKIARFWLPQIIEVFPIPFVDFGLTTLGVVLTILFTWSEDYLNIDLKKQKNLNLLRSKKD